MKKIYRVKFEVHKNCCIYQYEYYCIAKNIKDACEIAKSNWKRKEHQFHLEACYSGEFAEDCDMILGVYHCVNQRTWRVNGKNLYV